MYGTSFPSAVTIQMYCSAVNIIKDAIIKNARAVRSRIRDCPRERFIRIHNSFHSRGAGRIERALEDFADDGCKTTVRSLPLNR
jgi:hypothetical protein